MSSSCQIHRPTKAEGISRAHRGSIKERILLTMKYVDKVRKKRNQVEDQSNINIGGLVSLLIIVGIPYLRKKAEGEDFRLIESLAMAFFFLAIVWLVVEAFTKADTTRGLAIASAVFSAILAFGPDCIAEMKESQEFFMPLIKLVVLAIAAALATFIVAKIVKRWDDD